MTRFSIIFLLSILISCNSEDCPQGINKLPMFGNMKKCKGQLESDMIFIKQADKNFLSRDSAYQ